MIAPEIGHRMKVLIVCRGKNGSASPFIKEQVDSLIRKGLEIDYFLINGGGFSGYLKNLPLLKQKIKKFKPQLIHAHYGLSGLLAGIQRIVPVIVTYHGSDINKKSVRKFSLVSMLLAKKNIFVSSLQQQKIKLKADYIIPCGVSFELFKPEFVQRSTGKKKILFSSAFDNPVKNASLARKAISLIDNFEINLVELKGFSRLEVVEQMNQSDLCLLTSFSEGSPQFIKEAMACNVPIVSTNVGDIKDLIGKTEGCYIASFEAEDIKKSIINVFESNRRTKGRENIKHLEINIIAKNIIEVYTEILKSSTR